MIIKCTYCGVVTGTRPPYGGWRDKEVVLGLCDDCLDQHLPHHADMVRSITGPLGPKNKVVKGTLQT